MVVSTRPPVSGRGSAGRLDRAYQEAAVPSAVGNSGLSFRLITLAGAGYALTAALLGFAIWLAIIRPMSALASGISAAAVAALALRTAPWPPSGRRLRPVSLADLPRFGAAITAYCRRAGLPPPAGIALIRHDVVDLRIVGWRGRRILLLGVPRWVAAEPEERTCLLVHYLSHALPRRYRSENRPADPRGCGWIRNADAGVGRWCRALRPLTPHDVARRRPGIAPAHPPRGSLTLAVTNALVYVPYRLAAQWQTALRTEIARCAQRAEHAADVETARIVGGEAAQRWLGSYFWRDALADWLAEREERGLDLDVAELSAASRQWRATRHHRSPAGRVDDAHAATSLRLAAVSALRIPPREPAGAGFAAGAGDTAGAEHCGIAEACDAAACDELLTAYRRSGGADRL